jgi:hypothetical protein
VLRFFSQDGSLVFAKYVDISPRPFFYPSLRAFVNSGRMERAIDHEIDRAVKAKEL